MPKYKYEGNLGAVAEATSIILEVDGSGNVVRSVGKGDVGDFTYAQYLSLKNHFVLTEVEEDKVEEKEQNVEVPRPKPIELGKKPVAPAAERP